jgi:hypothetical protein
MFLDVKAGVERDVKTRNEIEKASGASQFFRCQDHGDGFSVFTESAQNPMILEFRLSPDEIVVSHHGDPFIRATITFTNECECKLVVGGEELYPWQFRKKALEGLFFGER